MSETQSITRGRLVLVPNTLDLGAAPEPLGQVLPTDVIGRAAQLQHWVVENAKSARAFLKRVDEIHPLTTPLQALQITELPRAAKGRGATTPATDWHALLKPTTQEQDVGLLSEAGLPGVADPGAELVAAAHRAGIGVEVLAGSSSLTLAVAASGLNGQRFAFEGYLPQDPAARLRRIRQLEQRSANEQQTQLVIETPYRNNTLLKALLEALKPETHLSVACGLTSAGGFCVTADVRSWRSRDARPPVLPATLPDKLPAVFLWLAR